MAIINRVAARQDELAAWRRDLHAHPELGYDLVRTAATVAEKLRSFGCDDVVEGVGRSGVVGVIRGRRTSSGRVIGIRADMDALPIQELVDHPYKSRNDGRMHACGHDGHTTMLLGAAAHLAETRNFDGTVVVIFQPAEEGGAGAKAMIDDGLMDRFAIQEVYGMHNMPGIPAGRFAMRYGPIMAAADRIAFRITGNGAHAAKPHLSIDPVAIGCQLHAAVQSIVSRNVDPLDNAVVSLTQFNAGTAFNIIPQTAEIRGTVRTLEEKTRAMIFKRLEEIAAALSRQHGASVEFVLEEGYPVTVSHDANIDVIAAVARDVVGEAGVDADVAPMMGGEDFSFMLRERPGAFIWVGNGDSAGLHHPRYDFDDSVLPAGISLWVRLAEMGMPVR